MRGNSVVILGAGFSRPVGLPLANDIKVRFDRDQREKLLNFSSSEWMWEDGKTQAVIHNGKMFHDWLPYSYALNEIIKAYKKEKGSFDNYELFYQYINEKRGDSKFRSEIYENATNELLKDHPSISDFEPEFEGEISPWLFRFSNDTDLSNIVGVVNYLVADLLGFSKTNFQAAIAEYDAFIDYIKRFETVDIFTLNHDLLLEWILDFYEITFSRGFSTIDSEIQYEEKPLPVFKNKFETSVRVHKLHGSIDFYRFEHFEDQGRPYLQPTGNYNYYCPGGYSAKHYAHRINPSTGERIQDINFDVVPKFITGINKSEIIKNDMMFSVLFERFEESLSMTDQILISGYSFGDVHVNNELQKHPEIDVINQNPSTEYPFEAKTKRQITSLRELD